MRLKAGTPKNVVLPVLAAVPPGGGSGVDMVTNFDVPAQFRSRGRPDGYQIKIALAGGVSCEYVLMLKDASDDWCVAGDTGNLGLLGGQPLDAGKTYVFQAQGLATAKEVALVEQNKNGAVVATAKITPIVDGAEG